MVGDFVGCCTSACRRDGVAADALSGLGGRCSSWAPQRGRGAACGALFLAAPSACRLIPKSPIWTPLATWNGSLEFARLRPCWAAGAGGSESVRSMALMRMLLAVISFAGWPALARPSARLQISPPARTFTTGCVLYTGDRTGCLAVAVVDLSAAGAAGSSAGGSQLKSSIATSASTTGVCDAAFAAVFPGAGGSQLTSTISALACHLCRCGRCALCRCGCRRPSHWAVAAGEFVTAAFVAAAGAFGASAFTGAGVFATAGVGAATATASFGAGDARRSPIRQVAACEPAIFVAQTGRERCWVLLAHDREHTFGVRFAREEAEAQAMTRAAVFDARDLVQAVVLETGKVLAAGLERVRSRRKD